MEQTVAERPFSKESQEQQINQQQTWQDGTVGPSDAKFQEDPSQSWCPRNQTGWSRTHMQPSGGYGRDNQTQDTGQIPVCRDFFRGKCFRGTSCRYQHSESGGWDGSRFVLCNDFLKGRCTYGASCKFQHSESDKHVMISSRSYGSGNYVANSGTSQFGGENRDAFRSRPFSREYRSRSPCRKFQIGICQHGESCPYLHSENTAFTSPKYELSSKLQQGVATTSRKPGFREGNIESTRSLSGECRSKSPCRDFLRGRCYRGPTCPYLHREHIAYVGPRCDWSARNHQGVAATSENPGFKEGGIDATNKDDDLRNRFVRREPRSRSPCRRFLSGRCFRGSTCHYLHPVMHDRPRYEYDSSTLQNQGLPEASSNGIFGEGNNTESMDISQSSRPLGEFGSGKLRVEVCLKFSRGRCDRGESCKYLHGFHEYARSIPNWSKQLLEHDHVRNDNTQLSARDGAFGKSSDDQVKPNNLDQKNDEVDNDINLWSRPFKRRRSRSRSPFTPLGDCGRRSIRREEFQSTFPRDRRYDVVPFRYPYRHSNQYIRPRYHMDNPSHSKIAANSVDSHSGQVNKGSTLIETNGHDKVMTHVNMEENMDLKVAATLEDSCSHEVNKDSDLTKTQGADSNTAIFNQKNEAECAKGDVESSHVKQDSEGLVTGRSESDISEGQNTDNGEEVESDSTSSCEKTHISPMDIDANVSRKENNLNQDGVEKTESLKTYDRKRRRKRCSKSRAEPMKEEVTDLATHEPSSSSSGKTSLSHPDIGSVGGDSGSHPLQTLDSSIKTENLNFKRKLLILDVNGLLADIVAVADVPSGYKPDTVVSMKAVFKRPFCDDFLEFCFERFDVGVWSSRTKKNVDRVLDFLMGNTKERLVFCLDQSHCTETGYKTIENKDKPLLLKELKKLWEKQVADLPWDEDLYNETNTVLLDDSPYKALRNPPYTAIFPYPYTFKDVKDRSLGPGGNLRVYLEKLAAADNFQKFIQENPFGQRPITKSNLSWAFYSKIAGACSSQKEGNATQTSGAINQKDGNATNTSAAMNQKDGNATNTSVAMKETDGNATNTSAAL